MTGETTKEACRGLIGQSSVSCEKDLGFSFKGNRRNHHKVSKPESDPLFPFLRVHFPALEGQIRGAVMAAFVNT